MSLYLLLFTLLAFSAGFYEWSRGRITWQPPEKSLPGAIASAVLFASAVTIIALQLLSRTAASRAIDIAGAIILCGLLWKAFGVVLRFVTRLARSVLWVWRTRWLNARLND